MAGTYKVIELVGTSPESWEKATADAIAETQKHLRDLRIAEVINQDVRLEDGKIVEYRVRLKVSFKYHGEGG
jgi:flavin-binding protein dodecin